MLEWKDVGKLQCYLPIANETKRYDVILKICDGPLCPCKNVHMTLSAPWSKQTVIVDISTKALSKDDDGSPHALELIRAMTAADWQLLDDYFLHSKAQCSEDFDPASVDAKFPIEEIERDGRLIHYGDILPYAEQLNIEVDGSKYLIIDSYCLRHAHPCAEVNLEFIPVTFSDDDYQNFGPTVLYVTHSAMLLEVIRQSSSPLVAAPDALFAAVKRNRDILRRCIRRHATLRSLYRQQAPIPRPTQLRAEAKTGRNEPCPCGSGKKYKKCCMSSEAITHRR